eukprot:COSAG01_NODE_3528_length_5967_cov_14.678255_4_plen_117_part_00
MTDTTVCAQVLDRLLHRPDDMRPKLEARYEAFQKTVQDLAQVFGDRLRRVNAASGDEVVMAEVRARIEGRAVAPRLIIAGPPGSGKGAQAAMIVRMHGCGVRRTHRLADMFLSVGQ